MSIIEPIEQASASDFEYIFYCPGCKMSHGFRTKGSPKWKFNGDLDNPTLSPSLLVRYGENKICHSFIKGGHMQFLSDCTHELAGQTVKLEEDE